MFKWHGIYFFFDELLYQLSKSKYNKNFVFKGGLYLQNILGVESRSTMDIDFKLISSELSNDELKNIFIEICSINGDNNIIFNLISVDEIRAYSIFIKPLISKPPIN